MIVSLWYMLNKMQSISYIKNKGEYANIYYLLIYIIYDTYDMIC